MKRKIFSALCLLLVAAGAAIYVMNRTYEPKNPLAVANVEALTDEEAPTVKGYNHVHMKCYKTVYYGGVATTVETGKWMATCWESPNSNESCHKHDCSDCSSK